MADEAAISAPAATSTPVAAPVAVSTPAAAAPVVSTHATQATPVTPAAEVTLAGSAVVVPTVPNEGESTAAFLARVIAAKNGGAVEAPAAEDDDEDSDDEPNASTGDGTEEPVVEEPVVADAEGDEYDPFESTPGLLSPKDLNSKILASPELKAALEANPDLKNSLFAASRLAAETASFKEIFANADEAKVASQGNAEFATLSDLVTSIDKPEDASAFYGRLMQLSILQDEDGNPILDANGKPRSDGTVGNLIHHTGALFLNHFGLEAETKNDPELAAAVDILRARAFGGPAPTDQGDLTEEQQAREAALVAERKALNTEKQTAQQARIKDFNNSITAGIDLGTNTKINELLARTDIAEADRGALADTIRKNLYELVVANNSFKAEQDGLMRRPMGDKTRIARIGLGKKYVDAVFTEVAGKAIAAAGAKIMSRQAKSDAAQAARVAASRSEAAGSLRTTRPAAPANAQQSAAAATAALTAKLGRTPSFAETLAEINRTRAGQ